MLCVLMWPRPAAFLPQPSLISQGFGIKGAPSTPTSRPTVNKLCSTCRGVFKIKYSKYVGADFVAVCEEF